MRLITFIPLTLILLSCSSKPTVKQDTHESTLPPSDRISLLEDTTVSYDRSKIPEITMDESSDSLPKLIFHVNPHYPEIARQSGIQGNVIVQTLVSPSGQVRTARILSSDAEIFNRPALEAAMKWRFEPPTVDGKPVAVWLKVPFRFAFAK